MIIGEHNFIIGFRNIFIGVVSLYEKFCSYIEQTYETHFEYLITPDILSQAP